MNVNSIPPINKNNTINVVIEIPKGSEGVKYEYNFETETLDISKIFKNKIPYPFNYGFIPQTLASDGDALDVIVLSSQRLEPLSIVKCRVLGVVFVEDQNGLEAKIIALPSYSLDQALSDLESVECAGIVNRESTDFVNSYSRQSQEIQTFLENYKKGEEVSFCKVNKFGSSNTAIHEVLESIELYKQTKNSK